MLRRLLLALTLLALGVAILVLPTFGAVRDDRRLSEGPPPPYTFPEGFWWGTATAAEQIEGFPGSDWDALQTRQLLAQAGRETLDAPLIQGLDRVSTAVIERRTDWDAHMAEDLAAARAMGGNAYRFSIAWERLFLTANQEDPDPAGLEYYRDVLDLVETNGLTPSVTLFHFALPSWLAAEKDGKKGWERADALDRWERFVRAVATAFGPRVHHWCTLNEPMVYVYNGFLQGLFPPLERRAGPAEVAPVLAQLLRAHALAARVLHEQDPAAKVGFTQHTRAFQPYRNHAPLDRLTAASVDQAFVWDLVDAVQSGHLRMTNTDVDVPIDGLTGTLDWLGINYYGRYYVKAHPWRPGLFEILEADPADPAEEVSDLGWASYPAGLRAVLGEAWRRAHLPIYLLETGIADAADPDLRRQRFLVQHAREAALAIRDGVDLRGFFVWSLLDNFEWAEGYGPRFGLLAVDYEHGFARHPRGSAEVFRRLATANGVDAALWAEHGE